MSTAIVWFRQDLRCEDNPAFARACNNHQQIVPLYIYDSASSIGAAQQWWLHHSLQSLSQDLANHGMALCLKKGNPLDILLQLIKSHSIDTIYWNRLYEPQNIKRDSAIKGCLIDQGINVNSSNSALLNEPWQVKNKQGGYFKVFTPYWKQCLRQISPPVASKINHWPPSPQSLKTELLNDWALLPYQPNWAQGFENDWLPGEAGANKNLQQFIDDALTAYKTNRNVPAISATSRLSPHLHFGEISPWKIWRTIQQAMQETGCDLSSAEHFISELGWREFSYHLLYHFPALPNTNFRQQFDNFPWQKNTIALQRWQKGLTGFPIVDAGMRELWETGYMHNRVRMIVASFLVKDLLIDWREGAAWFMETLLDADVASNSASWQWVAGCGVDAAPYFRIFNPILQGEKFDPQGIYVKRWVPELADVPAKWVHKPWEMPASKLSYPKPMVDHTIARQLALSYYHELSQTKELR